MNKLQLKVICLAALAYPWAAQSTEADFTEAKAFVEKVYQAKNAERTQSEYSTRYNFLSIDQCDTTYTDYVNSYAYVHFRNQNQSGASFTFNEFSNIRFERNENNEITKMIIQETQAFDCEEEGCSQEGEVIHEVGYEKIVTQSYEQQPTYNYLLVTDTCKI